MHQDKWFSLVSNVREMRSSFFLNRTLQWMLALPCKIHYLGYFGFRDFIGVHTTDTDASAMNVEHNARCFFSVFAEEALKDVDDELHWRVIVVQH